MNKKTALTLIEDIIKNNFTRNSISILDYDYLTQNLEKNASELACCRIYVKDKFFNSEYTINIVIMLDYVGLNVTGLQGHFTTSQALHLEKLRNTIYEVVSLIK